MAINSDQSYFMSHILPVYKRAAVWDDNMCLIVQGGLGSLYKHGSLNEVHLVGSCADGACSPRSYKTPPVLEVDIMKLFDGPWQYYGQPHPNKVGVWVDDSPWWEGLATGLATGFYHIGKYPSHPNSKHIYDAYHKAHDIINSNPLYFPKWYEKPKTRTSSIKGPAIKNIDKTLKYDEVIAFHHQGWPKEAEEWRTRARLWPPESVVEKVLEQGYQVVPKWSSSTGDLDGPLEWHITFTLCERYLARQRTPVQRLVYLMAKTLFYTYLDLYDDDNPNIDFPSYAIKTCMMWLMEQIPVDRWTEDNVPFLLRKMLTHLRISAYCGRLKNYFMIEANVLSNCTPHLLERIRLQLTCILSDVGKFLQRTELYNCNILLHSYYLIKGGYRAYDKVEYQYQTNVRSIVLLQVIQNIHKARATYQHIIEILKQDTGEGLQAKGYLFDEEECFHIFKAMMNVLSYGYINGDCTNRLGVFVHLVLGRYPLQMVDLIENVLCLDQQIPDIDVTILRLHIQWQDGIPVKLEFVGCEDSVNEFLMHTTEWKIKLLQGIAGLPGETDVIVVRVGQDINVYKWSDIGDLIEHYVRDLHDNEADRWMPQIYSLTHRDIPVLQMWNILRMLYLLYICDDKIDKQYNHIKM